jgi:hypothetical protein
MADGLFAVKRVSDGETITIIADVDTGADFDGLLSPETAYTAQFPDGTTQAFSTLALPSGVSRLAVTQLINDESNQLSYSSAGTHTLQGATDFVAAIISIASEGGGPEYATITLGAASFTMGADYIGPGAVASGALMYLKAADLPAGANTLTVNFFNAGDVPQQARACNIQLIEYSGVDQADPVYVNAGGFSNSNVIGQSLTLQGADDHALSVFYRRANGVTSLPASTDVTTLATAESGVSNSNAHAVAIGSSSPGAAGLVTHTATFASSLRTDHFMAGIRAST